MPSSSTNVALLSFTLQARVGDLHLLAAHVDGVVAHGGRAAVRDTRALDLLIR